MKWKVCLGGWRAFCFSQKFNLTSLENFNPMNATQQQRPPAAADLSQSSQRPGTSKSFFQHSPALSQISHDATAAGGGANRRLFGTPHGRIASTPFVAAQQQPAAAEQVLSEYQQMGLLANARKRRLEDLFGDINDIEEDAFEDALAKKSRSEAEIDLEMIEKILRQRKQLQAQLNPLRNTHLDKLEALHRFKMQNLSYSLPKWPFTTLVRFDRERLYVRHHSTEFEAKQIDEISISCGAIGGGRNVATLLGADVKQTLWTDAQKIV